MDLFYFWSINNMHPGRIFRHILLVITLSVFTACSSSPKSMDTASTTDALFTGPVNEVTISFTDEAQAKLEAIDDFDMIEFNQTVLDAMDAEDLFSAASDKSLEILIKNVNAASTNTAVLADINSDTAHIKGDLIIKDKTDKIVGQSEISSESIQGKSNHSQGEVKPELLYKQFATVTTQTLSGSTSEESPVAPSVAKEDPAEGFLQFLGVILSLAAFAAGYSAGL
ncbi:MAG: hypothetical protein ABW092_14685 [Candidatus Thiodiazotropha sp.]